jgi:hypothetical protein
MTPRKLNYYLLVFQDMFPYFLSLSLSLFSHRERGEGTEGYRVGGCKLRRSYQVGFMAPQCNSRGGEAVGLAVGLHRRGEKSQ